MFGTNFCFCEPFTEMEESVNIKCNCQDLKALEGTAGRTDTRAGKFHAWGVKIWYVQIGDSIWADPDAIATVRHLLTILPAATVTGIQGLLWLTFGGIFRIVFFEVGECSTINQSG